MKTLTKRIITGAGMLVAGLAIMSNTSEAKMKLVKKNISVIQGSNRSVEMEATDVNKLKIKGKKYAKVTVKDFQVKIKGKKAGKVTVTFKIPDAGKKYKITATILAKKKTNKTATKKLKKYLSKLPEGTQYAFVDINKDGIKDLYLEDQFVYYDYQKKKCKTKAHNFKEIYISTGNQKRIYTLLKEPRETESFVYFSEVYEADMKKVFKMESLGIGFRQYTDSGKIEYGVLEDYAYYDDSYDQDDYDYEGWTEEAIKTWLEENEYEKVEMQEKE